ncbi:hypothetical protein BVH56_05530 [Abyssicoccus albus]|nr:hypothetical protein BVH56_05530 [Abyssicoccus albus]
MNVKIKGIDEVNKLLDSLFSKKEMRKIVDKGLIEGAKEIKAELINQFESFKDTGHSINEITISKPMTINGVPTISIYWSGPKNRYTIIHLNEFGTIKNPNPRGKGAIERALSIGQEKYVETVSREIRRSLK